jgi:hypothetical protein
MTRHKDKAVLYWFEPPESKTLCLVLWFVLIRSQVEVVGIIGANVEAHVPWDALARLILGDRQGRWTGVQVGYSREPISSLFTSWKAYPSCLNPSGLSCLAHQALRSFWIRSSGESS